MKEVIVEHFGQFTRVMSRSGNPIEIRKGLGDLLEVYEEGSLIWATPISQVTSVRSENAVVERWPEHPGALLGAGSYSSGPVLSSPSWLTEKMEKAD